jgi:hypothetical protein
MNEEQQNITIAKLMGAKWVKSLNPQTPNKAVLVFLERLSLNYGDEIVYVNESDENFTKVVHAHVPDYCNDLNAMHEAEATLDFEQAELFEDELCDVTFKNNDGLENPLPCRFSVCHATSRQRAEAFLKTIEKWEGGSDECR